MISYDSPCLIGLDVMSDIEMFQPYCESTDVDDQTVLKCFEPFLLNKGCKDKLIKCLETPIINVTELTNRQKKLKLYDTTLDQNPKLDAVLKTFKSYEDDLHWVLSRKEESEEIIDSLDYVFIKWKWVNEVFNTSKVCLGVKSTYTIIFAPLFGILSPLLSIIIPYLVMVYKFKIKIPLKQFIRFVSTLLFKAFMMNLRSGSFSPLQVLSYIVYVFMYFHTLYNTVCTSYNTCKVVKFICDKMIGFVSYIKSSSELFAMMSIKPNISSKMRCILQNKSSYRSCLDYLVWFKEIEQNKNDIKSQLLEFVDIVNTELMFASISIALKGFKRSCFVDYIVHDNVVIKMTKMHHICLPSSVTNDLTLTANNCLITGPNAAGKSTFVKAVVINVLLAQSLGIAIADSMAITPIYFINTQINIPDSKGKMSLFEAEMYRCKYILDIVKELPPVNKCLFVMDELFNSTNPIEGSSSAYAVMKKLGSYTNACSIVTTHLMLLSKLKNFVKLKMEKSENDGRFTFTIRKGVSKQFLAVEMLKDHFDQDIVREAIKLKNKLLV